MTAHTRPAVALALAAALAPSRLRAQSATCAAAEREADVVHAERAAAPPPVRRAVNERAVDRLAALHTRCDSPWVSLHLGLAEAALERWGESCFHLSRALASGDPRVERLREGPLRRVVGLVAANVDCPAPPPSRRRAPVAAPVARVDARPAPAPAASGASSAMRVLGWTGVGVGAAGLAAGAVFWGLTAASLSRMRHAGASDDPRYRDLYRFAAEASERGEALIGTELCIAMLSSPQERGGREVCAEHRLLQGLALGFGVGGAAVALAGALVLAAAPAPSRASPRVTGWFNGEGGGALVEGSF